MIEHWLTDPGREKGLSLVELLVAVVLIGILAGVTARMLITGAGIFHSVSSRNNVLHSNRIGMEFLSRDLRSVKGSNYIVSAGEAQFTFTSMNNESVAYSFSGGTLFRNNEMVADGMGSFRFTYFDRDGDTLSTPVTTVSEIWDIKISIDAVIDGKNFHLESRVHPRNIH